MSQMTGNKASAGKKTTASKNFSKDCAVVVGDGSIVGGKSLGVETCVNAKIWTFKSVGVDPWMGFELEFPLGRSNEDDGFGKYHARKFSIQMISQPEDYADTPSGHITPTAWSSQDNRGVQHCCQIPARQVRVLCSPRR